MNTAMKEAERALDAGRDGKGFVVVPLTQAQRKAMDIAGYYRPFALDGANLAIPLWQSILKRGADIVLSAGALAVLSPILLGFMLAVFIEDPHSSPIFCQKRIGKGGKKFVMYKLRSMYTDAEKQLPAMLARNEVNGNAFKIKNDPRISRVGRVARKYCIDEVFQLVNVLKADMSLVGPRPPLPQEVVRYDAYERQRLAIKPGMTCYWQVTPHRHEISFEDWVAMDLKYILTRSLKADALLILRTFCVIFSGSGD